MKYLNVIIVEDEPSAASNLRSMLNEVAPHIKVMAVLTGIDETLKWLAYQPSPDLGFFDIQVADGLSFDILKKTEVQFPVIFTTAYDQYAIDAFKVYSIDYLLKPINEKALMTSLRKYDQLTQPRLTNALLEQIIHSIHPKQIKSFLVHYKDKLIPLPSSDIAYFSIGEGLVHAHTLSNHRYPLDHTLDELENVLDGFEFFRANRQYILNRKAIKDIALYFNGRLSVHVTPQTAGKVLVSKARASEFKLWMQGGG